MQTSPASQPFLKAKSPAVCAILFFLVFATFLPTLRNGFTTFDDPEYVSANPYVKAGITKQGLAWAFSSHGAHWHPLTWVAHLVNGQLFELHAWGHHLTSVFLHALNAMLVFVLLKRMTAAIGRSFVVALFFGLHPLRVESVAWAAELKDVLSTFFWITTTLAYVVYVQRREASQPRGAKRHYWLSVALFVLGLLCKSMLVTLPFTLLLLDAWPLARLTAKKIPYLVFEKLPFFLATIAMTLIAYLAESHGNSVVKSLTFDARLGNVLVSYCRYLGKIFWPKDLSPLYPFVFHWPLGMIWAAGLFLLTVSIFVLWLSRRYPFLAFGWFWYLGTALPVIGFVQIGEQSIADRYVYIPSLGIFIALVWGVYEITRHRPNQMTFGFTTSSVVAIAMIALTQKQITYWRNSETLFQRAVDVTQHNTLACVGLGISLMDRGHLDEAIARFNEALSYSPDYYEAHANLGTALMRKGDLNGAAVQFRAAQESRPSSTESYINLGVLYYQQHATNDAIHQFEQAAGLDPADPLPPSNLAHIYFDERHFDDAVTQFKLACRAAPGEPLLHYGLATTLANLKRPEAAAAEFQKALQLSPGNADIHNDYGVLLAQQNRLEAAAVEFQAAVSISPDFRSAQQNLAKIKNSKK